MKYFLCNFERKHFVSTLGRGRQDSIYTVTKIAQLQSTPVSSAIAVAHITINTLRVCSFSVHYTSVRQMGAEIMIRVVKVSSTTLQSD